MHACLCTCAYTYIYIYMYIIIAHLGVQQSSSHVFDRENAKNTFSSDHDNSDASSLHSRTCRSPKNDSFRSQVHLRYMTLKPWAIGIMGVWDHRIGTS